GKSLPEPSRLLSRLHAAKPLTRRAATSNEVDRLFAEALGAGLIAAAATTQTHSASRWRQLDQPASVSLPIAIAQLALLHLARLGARQLRDEVDRARALVVRDVIAAEADQLLGELGAGLVAGGRHHDGLHLLAEIVVGHADHGDVVHLRVRDEVALGLLRVDVHAARDDHVRLADLRRTAAALALKGGAERVGRTSGG